MSAHPPRRPAREWPIPPMDKGSGWKDTAFTWAMGHLILQRIADGETVKTITAHPAMPAYCTVFRWMHVVPEFGDAVRRLRAMMAEQRVAARDELRRARRRRRADGRPWHSGRRPRVSADALGRVLSRLRLGASVAEALAADPEAPSVKALYSRVRRCPGFRLAFGDACVVRELALELQRYDVIDGVEATGIRAANAELRALDARRGRLQPKVYRAGPPAGA